MSINVDERSVHLLEESQGVPEVQLTEPNDSLWNGRRVCRNVTLGTAGLAFGAGGVVASTFLVKALAKGTIEKGTGVLALVSVIILSMKILLFFISRIISQERAMVPTTVTHPV